MAAEGRQVKPINRPAIVEKNYPEGVVLRSARSTLSQRDAPSKKGSWSDAVRVDDLSDRGVS
jgi:hypothetical protein